ncbi:GerMN domain-containing protein [Micromonospora sp. DT229]|uniref:GerMN domain-containing protein n=1 Tax=Micromonospora sp. DT229 TaxID=3393430 RepID=UPI003CFBA908
MTGNRAGVAVAAVLLALVAACGVPGEDRPRVVTPPPGPLPPTATAAPTTAETGAVTEVLYFSRDDRLVPVTRRIDEVPAVEVQLRDLLAGPTQAERDDGLTNALTGALSNAEVELVDRQARVTVTATVAETGSTHEMLAYGQIVCTLTARADVDTVVFLRDGAPLSVPRGDHSLSPDPLTGADYALLITPR